MTSGDARVHPLPAGGNHQWHDDPGLQPERTGLSWGRTGVAMAVVALLSIRWLPDYGPMAAGLSLVLLLALLWLYSTQRRRYRRQALGLQQGQVAPALTSVLTAAGSVAAAAALAGTAVVVRLLQT